MPSQHHFPIMTIRTDPDLHNHAKVAVAQIDINLNAHVVAAFLRWLVHNTDDLPQRPTASIKIKRQHI
ncbi:hypothetical protein IU498_09585 [Nocardia beijingensis]|uniref:hypothetical protein n=1 Tax=Nocardia beijingensis TaxID=95162 RepID=UPI00189439FE|nr:hypothetical protein [Nocardia beijingensis]MBF6074878.1 hypothetical protein [Nocardia beijingensis]